MFEPNRAAGRTIIEQLRTFLRFAFLSGLGWVCDFVTYTILLTLFDLSAFAANFVSSYVGVTFVYLTSLQFVFNRTNDKRGAFLILYWGFQFVSILAYSALLQHVVVALSTADVLPVVRDHGGVSGKILVTPFNLFTNFLFMKFLTGFMKEKKTYA